MSHELVALQVCGGGYGGGAQHAGGAAHGPGAVRRAGPAQVAVRRLVQRRDPGQQHGGRGDTGVGPCA